MLFVCVRYGWRGCAKFECETVCYVCVCAFLAIN